MLDWSVVEFTRIYPKGGKCDQDSIEPWSALPNSKKKSHARNSLANQVPLDLCIFYVLVCLGNTEEGEGIT